MARSSCFGSTPSNCRACHTRFPSGSPMRLTSLLKVTRWPIIQKVRGHTHVLPLLVRTRFQILFTPLSEVLFAFPSRYWFTIGHSVVFSLRGWSPYLQTGYHVSRSTLSHHHRMSYTWLSHSFVCLPMQFYYPVSDFWAPAVSFATTPAISFDFFSSGYWDVSLLPVRLDLLLYS